VPSTCQKRHAGFSTNHQITISGDWELTWGQPLEGMLAVEGDRCKDEEAYFKIQGLVPMFPPVRDCPWKESVFAVSRAFCALFRKER
jgi:hypothetical protein